MGPRIPRRRKPERKARDELPISTGSGTTMLRGDRNATGESLGKRRGGRHRMTPGERAVTHRSPAGDGSELPCCGRPVSDVPAHDRITTDPSQVTCPG